VAISHSPLTYNSRKWIPNHAKSGLIFNFSVFLILVRILVWLKQSPFIVKLISVNIISHKKRGRNMIRWCFAGSQLFRSIRDIVYLFFIRVIRFYINTKQNELLCCGCYFFFFFFFCFFLLFFGFLFNRKTRFLFFGSFLNSLIFFCLNFA